MCSGRAAGTVAAQYVQGCGVGAAASLRGNNPPGNLHPFLSRELQSWSGINSSVSGYRSPQRRSWQWESHLLLLHHSSSKLVSPCSCSPLPQPSLLSSSNTAERGRDLCVPLPSDVSLPGRPDRAPAALSTDPVLCPLPRRVWGQARSRGTVPRAVPVPAPCTATLASLCCG